jgi:uncharacterized protein involved in outer membrane biogenesis
MQIMPRPKFIKLLILSLILAGTFSLGLSILLPRLLDLNNYQTQLISLLQKQLNRQVRLGDSQFSWMFGPEFAFKDLYVQERNSTQEFLSANRITFRLALLPLLQKKIELREIVVDGARLTLSRDEQGILNIDDLLKPSADNYDLQVRGLRVRNGTLFWHDQATDETCTKLTISGINLSLDKLIRGKKCTFKLGATLEGSSPGSIQTSGTVKLPKTGELLHQSDVNAKIELNQLEYGRFWPYVGEYVPFPSPGGTLSLNLTLKGRWQNLQAKGLLKARNPVVNWPKVFHGSVAPKQLQLSVDMNWTPTLLDMSAVQLSLDGFDIKGMVKLSDLNSNDPLITVKAASESFDYARVKSYIPFGIIADDTADFIEHKIRGGIFKLTTGTLNGRISQLARFGIGDNANALYISGTADKASIQYGEKTPTFRQIRGTLEMKGRNFNLIGMSGSFGGSPFTLEGSITEYATEGVPSFYPFTMSISPKPAEVAWLAAHAGAELLHFEGNNTTMKLQGDGPSTAYRLAGEWLLSSASYQYPALVKKPAGMANSLTFSAVLGKDATRFSSFSYLLSPLKLSGNGLLRYSGTVPNLSFAIETNQFHLDQHLPILTDWPQYQLKGGVQAHLGGAGDPRSISSMLFSGTVKLTAFSLKPHPKYAPITDINTQISFKGNSLETSHMAIRYGSTPLHIKGRIASLKNPEAELFITSPDLNPIDFGLSLAEKPPRIRQFSTQLGFRDGLLTIRNVSGRLPKTILSASGTVRTTGIPDINLRIASSHLDLEEIIPLLAPARTAQSDTQQKPPTPFKLQAQLTAAAGNYRTTSFSNLSASLKNEGGILKLQGLHSTIMGGRLALNGQLARTAGQAPKWDLSFLLEQAKAGELLQTLGIGREVRGLATVKGRLSANGDQLDEIKKTASGAITLKVERGALKRFNSLSKVISILNVSQLLSFSLPDMARDGMPFNQITATIGVKNGILTTQDFFIDSNVMHVTTVGSIDIVKETLDMLIGVQPLQTVDRIVSRIPVVGWILSGGDGSLITTYFEAKGSWENPEVTAIPVKTMAKGTLDIFRRVFELPVRLFTDSGEVILGNQKERPKAGEVQNQ